MKIPVYELRRTENITVSDSVGVSTRGTLLKGPQGAADILRACMAGSGVEEVWVLCLDARRRVVAARMVSRGTLTQSLAHPREIWQLAVQLGAAAIVVGHNHPSGDPAPSPDDNALTRRLRDSAEILGIPLVDHMIIGETESGNGWYSYAENGWRV